MKLDSFHTEFSVKWARINFYAKNLQLISIEIYQYFIEEIIFTISTHYIL